MNTKKNIKKNRFNPKIKVFIILLFFAAIYWFFTSLSEKYVYATHYDVNYTNIPKGLLFQNTPSDRIQAQIEATGFEILSHKLNNKSLTFDLSNFKHTKDYAYYYLLNKDLYNIQKQVHATKLVTFEKDSLIVYLGNLKSKKVPVISKVQLFFKSGFKLTENLLITPDSLSISGPEKYIDNIQSIKTTTEKIVDIQKDFNVEIPLLITEKELEKVSYETLSVRLSGKVAKFTEGIIELEIKLPQIPEGVKMELFPKTAIIKYAVTFENYKKIDSSSFYLTCKYPGKNYLDKKKLDLFLLKKPDFIKNFTIEPTKTTYLIQYLESDNKIKPEVNQGDIPN